MKPRIQTKKDTFTIDYPEARAYMDKQASIFWPHFEVKVAKDKQDILVNMTEAERHGVITVLKLFTKYEQIIGDDFWMGFVMKKFPRPADIQPMASLFSAIELSTHAPFYTTLNEELGLSTDEFYESYKDDEVLRERIEFLKDTLYSKDDLRSLGAFTFGEGAVLYTSFAYLKHFQTGGKNKMLNVVSGINFSARDEALHSEAAGWLFRTLKEEMKELGLLTPEEEEKIKEDMYAAAETVLLHEERIIEKIFEKGKVEGITSKQLSAFAKSRINVCLRSMGYENLYKIDYNPIADTFYKSINGFSATDFFSSQGNQYQRDWSEKGFTF